MTQVPILSEARIRALVSPAEALGAVRRAFVRLAQAQATLPPAMGFEVGARRGEVHVKAAHIHGERFYTVKIASGFYANAERGLPVSNGMMVVFDAQTGNISAILLDNGYLTELRTGAAGALAADLLAKRAVLRVGIIGCGTQARFQLEALRGVREFEEVLVHGRSAQNAQQYAREMRERLGLNIAVCGHPQEVVEASDIVVTTTPARSPIVKSAWLHPGIHLTAMGSDAPGKQELDCAVLAAADKIVVDHRDQCLRLGELQHATQAGISARDIHAELGEVAAGLKPGRTSQEEITLADLTGVGVQDAALAELVVDKALAAHLL